ncbi:MAG: rod shape-determining protein [Acidobacteria bacterium]|nr:rod shape-determining protein [Acidobacteriota bacterium]
MATDVAIDLGTSRTRLATDQRGVLIDEPTLVALDTSSGDVVEIGDRALALVGRLPRHVVVFRPLAEGTTVDFDVTARLISGLFERAGISKLSRARVIMSVPTVATSIERRALRQAAVRAGAKEVTLMEAPVAAAIGLGLPVQDPVGSAVAVLGAGVTEAALISLGGIVTSAARRVGGNNIEENLASLLRIRHNVVVSPAVLEELKVELGSARGRIRGHSVVVRARRISDGRPVEFEVAPELVNAAVTEVASAAERLVQECLGDAPPDLSQDVSTQGVALVGGHSQLADVAELLETSTGVSVNVAHDPGTVIVRGLAMCLEQMSNLHSLFREIDR